MLNSQEGRLTEALHCMSSALHLLDEAGAPGDIGSHLDLAICRLETTLGPGGVGAIEERLLASEYERLLSSDNQPLSPWDTNESELVQSSNETARDRFQDA